MPASTDDPSLPELAAQVAELGAAVQRLAGRLAASDIHPWLTATDPDTATDDLVALVEWLGDVWLHYPGPSLPECWWRHPWVIEELNAARHAWLGCLRRGAPPTGFAEWHRTVRAGVQQRIQAALATCADDQHPVARPVAVSRPDSPAAVVDPWLADRSEPSRDLA